MARAKTKKMNIDQIQNNLFLFIGMSILLSLAAYVFCVYKTTAYAYDIRTTTKEISKIEEIVLELETEVSLKKGYSDMDIATELGYVQSYNAVYLRPKDTLFSFSGSSDKIR